MTLQELWMVIVRRWKLVVALPVVCALACAAYLFATHGEGETQYTATAYVVGNSQVTAVASIANNEALQLFGADEEPAMTVKASVQSGTTTVQIVATGDSAQDCIDVVNQIAEHANDAATEFYADFENPYSGIVQEASMAEEGSAGSRGGLKYLLVAVLAGLFIAVFFVVVFDMRKRPVKTPGGAQDAVELPVLEMLPAPNGERLLANVRFAAGEEAPQSVLVVPVGDEEAGRAASALLKSAVEAEHGEVAVECSEPLSQGMAGAYASREAGAVVVAVRQWADSLPQLESTVAELRLAGANLTGIAFAKENLA